MTPLIDDPATLRRILRDVEVLVLDFDGPMCAVFAGIPASAVADQLRQILADGGFHDLPDDVLGSADPFVVLRHAGALGDDEARYVETALAAHELEAVAFAVPTPGAEDLVHAWKKTGRPLGIASNNSAAAVQAYLHIRRLNGLVDYIAARIGHDLSELKPSPFLVNQCLYAFQARPDKVLMVGDAGTDLVAADRSGVRFIGYANKSRKAVELRDERASAVVSSMALLTEALS